MDNLLLRIPVIAGASLLASLAYFGLHRLLGQLPPGQVIETVAYSLIGTTIAGTLIYVLLDYVLVEKKRGRKPEFFSNRRQTRRKNPIRFSR